MSDRSDDRLRRTVAALDDVAAAGEQCPPAEMLWESARGTLDLESSEEMVLHLGECGACAAAWRVTRDMAQERAPVPARTRWMPVAAAAAVFVVAFGLAAVWKLRTADAPPVFRTQERSAIEAGAETKALSRARFELAWTAVDGATYDLVITQDDLEAVHRVTGLEAPTYRVPVDALAQLPSGARLFWQVTAHRSDGRTLVSDTFVSSVE